MGIVSALANDGGGGDVVGFNVEHRKEKGYAKPTTRNIPAARRNYINNCTATWYDPWSCAEPDALTLLIVTRGVNIDYNNVEIFNPREDGNVVMTPCENCQMWLTEKRIQGADRVYRLNDELLKALAPPVKAKPPINLGLPKGDPVSLPKDNPWSKGPPKF